MSAHTFKLKQRVQVVTQSQMTNALTRLARESALEIRDLMPVSPGDQKDAGHHQRVKVGVPGEKRMSDWISGAWFEPA